MTDRPKPAACPHCGASGGNLVQQPNGTWMCIDCYWEDVPPTPLKPYRPPSKTHWIHLHYDGRHDPGWKP